MAVGAVGSIGIDVAGAAGGDEEAVEGGVVAEIVEADAGFAVGEGEGLGVGLGLGGLGVRGCGEREDGEDGDEVTVTAKVHGSVLPRRAK